MRGYREKVSTRHCRGERSPDFDTVLRVMSALGLRLHAKAAQGYPKGTEARAFCMSHRQARGRGASTRRLDLAVPRAPERAVENADWFLREVETGLAQVGAGQTLTREAVGTRLTRGSRA